MGSNVRILLAITGPHRRSESGIHVAVPSKQYSKIHGFIFQRMKLFSAHHLICEKVRDEPLVTPSSGNLISASSFEYLNYSVHHPVLCATGR
jgi:hypothetical protein